MNAFTEARMHPGVELRGAGRHPTVLSKAIATLDVVSAGRAGWEPVNWREAGPVAGVAS